jgi:hypothetical protein
MTFEVTHVYVPPAPTCKVPVFCPQFICVWLIFRITGRYFPYSINLINTFIPSPRSSGNTIRRDKNTCLTLRFLLCHLCATSVTVNSSFFFIVTTSFRLTGHLQVYPLLWSENHCDAVLFLIWLPRITSGYVG